MGSSLEDDIEGDRSLGDLSRFSRGERLRFTTGEREPLRFSDGDLERSRFRSFGGEREFLRDGDLERSRFRPLDGDREFLRRLGPLRRVSFSFTIADELRHEETTTKCYVVRYGGQYDEG